MAYSNVKFLRKMSSSNMSHSNTATPPINDASTRASMHLASTHYENFPVASIFLPSHLRQPIALIYSFARQADDFADEGDLTIIERLHLLNSFKDELDCLQAYIKPNTAFFSTLGNMIRLQKLPYAPFYDLLDAFSQDVTKTRYANIAEVLDYCERSANPIGRLLLHLYKEASEENLKHADNICSALQIINFLQDVAVDSKKNAGKQRIYMCQNELHQFGINEQQIIDGIFDAKWQAFMEFNLSRVHALLTEGKPLGCILKGRIGFEMRLVIAGGEQIIKKLYRVKGDIFNHRPTLNKLDWCVIFLKAVFKR